VEKVLANASFSKSGKSLLESSLADAFAGAFEE
jgi:hypothetical protein